MTCTICNGLRLTFAYCDRCDGVGKEATQYGLMICTKCRGDKKYTRRCQDCLPATKENEDGSLRQVPGRQRPLPPLPELPQA